MGIMDSIGSALGTKIGGTLGGSLLTGGLSVAGSMLGNVLGQDSASKQMRFQRRMSSSSHQREVADLRAAGLNPILSATGGSGASTPTGAAAKQEDPITPGVNSALSLMRTMAETANLQADTLNKNLLPEKTEAETDKLYEESHQAFSAAQLNRQKKQESMASEDLMDAQRERIPYEERLLDAQRSKASMESALANQTRLSEREKTIILGENKQEAKAAALKALTDQKINESWYGKILRFIERSADAVAVPISAIRGGRKSGGITINNQQR